MTLPALDSTSPHSPPGQTLRFYFTFLFFVFFLVFLKCQSRVKIFQVQHFQVESMHKSIFTYLLVPTVINFVSIPK